MPFSLPQAVLWDMDGTLIDQTAAILRCYQEVVSGMGYPSPDEAILRRSLGGPMASTMRLFVESDRLDEAGRQFRARFPEIMFDGLILMPGAHELIRYFHQHRIPQAIFTNKHGATARKVSEHCGFNKYIDVCIGSADTEWSKPDPLLTQYVLDEIDSNGERAVMIGDSPTDVKTAENAKMLCHGVATGAHSQRELLEAGAATADPNLEALKERIDSGV